MGLSAWYAPGAATAQMVESIVLDQKRIFPCCVRMSGHYGLDGVFMGAPVKLGKAGVEQIIELKLQPEEKALVNQSAEAVQTLMNVVDKML